MIGLVACAIDYGVISAGDVLAKLRDGDLANFDNCIINDDLNLEGRSKWTVRLLADKLVEIEAVDSISHMSVQQVLADIRAIKERLGMP